MICWTTIVTIFQSDVRSKWEQRLRFLNTYSRWQTFSTDADVVYLSVFWMEVWVGLTLERKIRITSKYRRVWTWVFITKLQGERFFMIFKSTINQYTYQFTAWWQFMILLNYSKDKDDDPFMLGSKSFAFPYQPTILAIY